MRASSPLITAMIAGGAVALPCAPLAYDAAVTRAVTLRGGDIGVNHLLLHEINPAPRDPGVEEDDVERYYPTTRRAFAFPGLPDVALEVRQTSFGCGMLGATVWPSAVALASLLGNDMKYSVEGRRVLELGSGCGLPSLVAKEVCGAGEVLATDYWEEKGKDSLLSLGAATGDRLIPKALFCANLAYNIGEESAASVRRLDWHNEMDAFKIAHEFQPDLIIGSDLIYYPANVGPLIRTLEILLTAGGGDRDALLVLPLPPGAEREALPAFRGQLEGGGLGGDCVVTSDELEMAVWRLGSNGGDERHNLLRVRVCHRPSR